MGILGESAAVYALFGVVFSAALLAQSNLGDLFGYLYGLAAVRRLSRPVPRASDGERPGSEREHHHSPDRAGHRVHSAGQQQLWLVDPANLTRKLINRHHEMPESKDDVLVIGGP
jgi:hypothetical protein